MLLAVDPGIRGCGAAFFFAGRLVAAAYVRSPCLSGNRSREAADAAAAVAAWARGLHQFDGWAVGTFALAVEWPRVYASRIRAGEMAGKDPNDLLPLAGVDAALVALLAPDAVWSYAPSEWKGQMPKAACARRVASRLDPAERALLDAVRPASLAHNAWDAVGIGLHSLGRLDPRRGR